MVCRIALCVCLLLASRTLAERLPAPPAVADLHHETPDDAYQPGPVGGAPSTRASQQVYDGYVSIQVNVDALGNNIAGDAANEPSMAVDPTDPNRIVIGWRQFDTISSNFRQAGNAWSHDRGQTWHSLPPIEAGVFRSDPVLASDADGVIYYNSLSTATGDFVCDVFKSYDGGQTWDSGTFARGGDKQWMAIDQSDSVGRGHIYAVWTRSFSSCWPDFFTRSTDGGLTYEPCVVVPGDPARGTISVGPDGEVYIAGQGIVVTPSTTLRDADLPMNFESARYVDLDGVLPSNGGPNPGGLLGQVWVDVDRSAGPSRGWVYVCSTVARSSTGDPADVMIARSRDHGATWDPPVRVNDDPPYNDAFQWFGTMAVAPNGRVDVIWNDTRDDPGGYDSRVRYAASYDGGQTFTPSVAVSPEFNPRIGWPNQNKIGDYCHLISDDHGARLAYAATFNGEQDVYFLRIPALCGDAGTLQLDRASYGCTDALELEVMDCGPNVSDSALNTITVTVASDTEPSGETIVLTETEPASARFVGTVAVDTTNASGVLHVAAGDQIIATYVDENDGAGHHNLPVTQQAVVDCTAPFLLAATTLNAQPLAVTLRIESDEPTLPTIEYGPACDGWEAAKSPQSLDTVHDILLSDLDPDTTYRYQVELVDEAGNSSSDGICRAFTTSPLPNYFTEQFDPNDASLANVRIEFTPDGGDDFYSVCRRSISGLPTDPTGGVVLPSADDFYSVVDVPDSQTVALYGSAHPRIHIGSNGYVTFDFGQTEAVGTLEHHFQDQRISGLYTDLDASAGGSISWRSLADRLAVSFVDVPHKIGGGANTFQIEMYFDGRIALNYLDIDAPEAIAGLSIGGGVPELFVEADLAATVVCDTLTLGDLNCDGVVNFGDIDPFVLAITDLTGYASAYADCDVLAADVNGDGLVNFGDIDGFVALLVNGP